MFQFVVRNDKYIPKRQTAGAAGYDLYATSSESILPGERKLIGTGLITIMGKNTYARIESRSSLALKHGVVAFSGIIDTDYDKEIKVILFNHGKETFHVKKMDRIAQLIFCNYLVGDTPKTNKIVSSTRSGGFGSTSEQHQDVITNSQNLVSSDVYKSFLSNVKQFGVEPNDAIQIAELVKVYNAGKKLTELDQEESEKSLLVKRARELQTEHQKIKSPKVQKITDYTN
tara:strand:+ start:350 stop:1036 length:687 start_codon:yes stop_codon:yes gene_type:complete